jgi:hypothetical protein
MRLLKRLPRARLIAALSSTVVSDFRQHAMSAPFSGLLLMATQRG